MLQYRITWEDANHVVHEEKVSILNACALNRKLSTMHNVLQVQSLGGFPEDCLSCAHSYSIPAEESDKGIDELYCEEKDKIVWESGHCKYYN